MRLKDQDMRQKDKEMKLKDKINAHLLTENTLLRRQVAKMER